MEPLDMDVSKCSKAHQRIARWIIMQQMEHKYQIAESKNIKLELRPFKHPKILTFLLHEQKINVYCALQKF